MVFEVSNVAIVCFESYPKEMNDDMDGMNHECIIVMLCGPGACYYSMLCFAYMQVYFCKGVLDMCLTLLSSCIIRSCIYPRHHALISFINDL